MLLGALGLTARNKKLVETSASLLVTSALLVVTRTLVVARTLLVITRASLLVFQPRSLGLETKRVPLALVKLVSLLGIWSLLYWFGLSWFIW